MIVALEAVLGLLAAASPSVDRVLGGAQVPPVLADPRLGHRPNPARVGHDRKGFRNLNVPARAEVVALGDSQTYGNGVSAESAWPQQLEAMTGKAVYNMGCGGYGPTHSLVLWDEVVAFSPQVVVEAFYAGNDLVDSFRHVYVEGQLPELRSTDPELLARIRAQEQADPIERHVARLFWMPSEWAAAYPANAAEATAHPRFPLEPWLRRHSKTYALLRRARLEARRLRVRSGGESDQDRWEEAMRVAAARPGCCELFDDGQVRTVFTSEYRLAALELDDTRIAEGLRLSLAAIERMQALAVARKIELMVVLVPTKEAVYRERFEDPSPLYRRLTENEDRVRATTLDFLERNGIEVIDALPALREQLAIVGHDPYPLSPDGHPTRDGHEAIARLVAARLESSR